MGGFLFRREERRQGLGTRGARHKNRRGARRIRGGFPRFLKHQRLFAPAAQLKIDSREHL